jgi:hypothetical protein
LETVGLRLNKSPPDVVIEKKPSGGVKFSHTVPLTKLGPEPGKTVYVVPLRENIAAWRWALHWVALHLWCSSTAQWP